MFEQIFHLLNLPGFRPREYQALNAQDCRLRLCGMQSLFMFMESYTWRTPPYRARCLGFELTPKEAPARYPEPGAVLSGSTSLSKNPSCLCVYLSVCLSVCPSACLSLPGCLPIGLSTDTYLCICVSVCLSVYLSIRVSIYLPIHLSVYLSDYLSIYLSVCQAVYASMAVVRLSSQNMLDFALPLRDVCAMRARVCGPWEQKAKFRISNTKSPQTPNAEPQPLPP